ncbi:hypothetical protein HQ865_02955 [Mucilaginibacter mali]|uniref:Cell division protein FtsL n=1 Tax=Mucilaginibacter mali TaxID=2740462 RepID=A0A7D4UNB1_9SPHI|nr:FtsL-like putative cell division protein [Mucilaginibacter mali]QKJ28760.1 hypothetical protein HQ865_02955 [Mucilaginibacter mali]
MSNRFRTEIEEEQAEQEAIAEEAPKTGIPENWFTTFLSKGVISTETATGALPFILFLAALGMIYIGNMHMAENNIREIDKLSKEVKELSWDYKTTKADLAFKSTLNEVTKLADTLGLKEPVSPPQKIVVKEDAQ